MKKVLGILTVLVVVSVVTASISPSFLSSYNI